MKIPPAARNIILGVLALAIFYFVSLVLFISFAKFDNCTTEILQQDTSPDNHYQVMVENKICRLDKLNMSNIVHVWLKTGQNSKKIHLFEGELDDVGLNTGIDKEISIRWAEDRKVEVSYSRHIKPSLTLGKFNDLEIAFRNP